ncbi:MAG: 4-hydroxy-tetrahydrodipicolinate reductase [Desulfatiglandales bacterium]
MIRVAVAGAMGRMGQRILWALSEDLECKTVYAFERPDHPRVGQPLSTLLGIPGLELPLQGGLQKMEEIPDVLIDFTTPKATLENAKWAFQKGVAMVIGTTGFEKEELLELKGYLDKIRAVLAPNMSVGVNLMFYLARVMAEILGDDFDVEILEAHHRMKKDAPSGTALKILEIVSQTLGRDPQRDPVFLRKGNVGERSKREIGMQVIRAGDIVGEHTLLFGGLGERLELTHRAHSRDTFAKGAVRAAKWVVSMPEGIYDMQDVLGLRNRS